MMKQLSSTTLLFFVFCIALSAQSWGGIRGEGSTNKYNIDLNTINELSLAIPATVYVTQSNNQSIRIEAQQNIFENIKQEVINGNWEIEFDKDVKKHDQINIYVSLAILEGLNIGGVGTIECTNSFKNLDDLNLNIGGTGTIVFNGDAEEINCSIGGLGTIEMEGQSTHVNISIGGSGHIKALNMETNKCNVSSAGSGNVEIHVNKKLDVSMVGGGKVHYKGSPVVNSSIIGSGDISKIN